MFCRYTGRISQNRCRDDSRGRRSSGEASSLGLPESGRRSDRITKAGSRGRHRLPDVSLPKRVVSTSRPANAAQLTNELKGTGGGDAERLCGVRRRARKAAESFQRVIQSYQDSGGNKKCIECEGFFG